VRHWDLTKKERRHEFALDKGYHTTMAVSPDGRLMAWACENRLQVWEVVTKFKVAELVGHRKHISALAFAPDGRTLASGGFDGAILLWDLTGCRGVKAPILKDAGLAAHWMELGQESGRRGIWELTAFPKESVPFLRKQLCTQPAADPTRIQQLVKDLDAAQFQARELATKELQELGETAAPALDKAIKDGSTLELTRRARQILERLEVERAKENSTVSTSTLRILRAIETLERIDTPEAEEVLRAMAAGEGTPRGQREANAALERMKRSRPAAK
jgi:hypothetical protein